MKNEMADKNIKVIYQFLINHNFESTAETLVQESLKMGFQNFECKIRDFTDPYAQLTLCYNTGNYSTFFQLWDDLFFDNIKQCKEYKKLTFYLHVYFAILPICKLYTNEYKEYEPTESEISMMRLSSTDLVLENHKNNGTEIEKNINNSMKQLQDYLSGNGKELEHDMELQPFYALPFTKDLRVNALFSKMLEPRWSDELSRNLDLFIANHKQDLADLSNMNYNKAQNLSKVYTIASAIKVIDTESVQNKTKKDNIQIVANDRDIPIFLEDNGKEQDSFSHQISRNLESTGTQTYITGDQIMLNNSRGYKSDVGENVDSLPRMYKQDKKMIQRNQESVLTKNHSYNIHTNHEELKLKFDKLLVDYRKLLSIAGVLTIALENSAKGQAVDVQQTLETCQNINPDLFNQNIRDTSCASLLRRGHSNRLHNTDKIPSKFDITTVPVSSKLLDFKKIKLHLLNEDVKTKLLLLQALRWKITLAQPTVRDEVLHEYMSHDLLGLHGQITSDNKPLLPCLLIAGEAYARHLLQQFTARLLNTLASFKYGRDYLSVGSTVVNVTFACLDNNYADGVDPFACDMLVAMLQKLSLRRQQRIYMIESGLLEWLISHLHDNCRIMSLYRLEYATALLMNLSLHRLAHARAAKISLLLVSTLLVLLSIDHMPSLHYINETLNNFLRNPVINEEARKMKRSNISDYIGGNLKTAEIRKHLDHILKMQRCENVNTPQNEETADDDNEERDVLESELDEDDPLKNYVGELNGETLLEMCYSVSSKIPEDVTIDTTLQKISTLNSIDFYNSQQNNHLCTGHPSYSKLRHSVEIEENISPKETYTKLAALAIEQVSDFSNSSLKEQKMITNDTNKRSFPADRVQNIAKGFIGTEASFIAKYKSREYEGWNGNFVLLKNTAWPLNATDSSKKNHDQYYLENRLKLRELEVKNDIVDSRDFSIFRDINSEKAAVKAAQAFRPNIARRITSNDIICLHTNQSPEDSSEIAVTSSTTFASSHKNGQSIEMEKFSSIASLNINNYDSNVINDTSWKNGLELAKEEEAFLAKPKISRTPP